MKKFLLLMVSVVFLMTGCGKLDIEINKDSSATFTYEFDLSESYYSASEIKEELTSTVQQANEDAEEEVVELKKFKEKDGKVTATIALSNIGIDPDEVMLVTVADMYRYAPDRVLGLYNAKGEKLTAENVEDYYDHLILDVSELDDMLKTSITFPGKVAFASKNADFVKDHENQIKFDDSTATVIYENKGGGFGFILPLIFILILAGAAFFFMKKRKGKVSTPTAPTPQTVQQVEGGSPNA